MCKNYLNRNIKKPTAPSGRGWTSSLSSNFSNFKFFTSSADLNTSKKGKTPIPACRLVWVSWVSRVGQIMIPIVRASIGSYLKQPSTNQAFEARSPRLQDLLREVPEAVVIFEWRMGKRTACTAKVQACCQNPAAGQDINDARIPKEQVFGILWQHAHVRTCKLRRGWVQQRPWAFCQQPSCGALWVQFLVSQQVIDGIMANWQPHDHHECCCQQNHGSHDLDNPETPVVPLGEDHLYR